MASGEPHEKEDRPLEHDGSSEGNLLPDPVSVIKSSDCSSTSSGITNGFHGSKLQATQQPNKSATYSQVPQDENKNCSQDTKSNVKVGQYKLLNIADTIMRYLLMVQLLNDF